MLLQSKEIHCLTFPTTSWVKRTTWDLGHSVAKNCLSDCLCCWQTSAFNSNEENVCCKLQTFWWNCDIPEETLKINEIHFLVAAGESINFLLRFCLFVTRSPGYLWKPCICAALRLVGLSDVSLGWHVDVHHGCWCVIRWVLQITEPRLYHHVVSSSCFPTNRQVNFAGSCPATSSGPLERRYMRYVGVSAHFNTAFEGFSFSKSDLVLQSTDVQSKQTHATSQLSGTLKSAG